MNRSHFCATVLLLAAALAGCAVRPAPQPAFQTTAQPSREVLGLDAAVTALADTLIEPVPQSRIVVDTFIDYATGEQNEATRTLERHLTAALRARQPGFAVEPLGAAALEAKPLVLLGAVAPVAGPGTATPITRGRPGAYRIWTVLVDPGTGRITARAEAWLRPEAVDPTPTRFVQAAPAWTPELTTVAYLQTADRGVGEVADPSYLEGVRAQALAADGTRAFEVGRYSEAAAIYQQARQLPGGQQMRVLNGAYLTYVALGQPREAADAFIRVVDHGLTRGRLAIRFVFQPGSTDFWRDRAVSGPYPVWLRLVSQRVAERNSCLILVGHASPTGPALLNERLSLARAEQVRRRLTAEQRSLGPRTKAVGRGAQQPLVGSGADDVTDVLDRRVEFNPVDCGALSEPG